MDNFKIPDSKTFKERFLATAKNKEDILKTSAKNKDAILETLNKKEN